MPRYRRKIFDADALGRLQRTFGRICTDFEATLSEFNGESGYVHLLVECLPKVAVSTLVDSLKGVSARRLRQERPDIAQQYWRGGLWSASYFAASCSGAPVAVLRHYIESRQAPTSGPSDDSLSLPAIHGRVSREKS